MPARLARPAIAWLVHHRPCNADHDAKNPCSLLPAHCARAEFKVSRSMVIASTVVNRQHLVPVWCLSSVQAIPTPYPGHPFRLPAVKRLFSNVKVRSGLSVRPLGTESVGAIKSTRFDKYLLTLATEAGTNSSPWISKHMTLPLVQATPVVHWAAARLWDVVMPCLLVQCRYAPFGVGAHAS